MPEIDDHTQPFALTLDKFLLHAAKWRPDAGLVTATAGGDLSRVGYDAVLERSRRFSSVLAGLGVVRGDRVATLAWNTQNHVEAWYGISGMGAIVHTLNPRLLIEQLAAMAAMAGVRVLVASAQLAAMAGQLARLAPSITDILIIDDAAPAIPSDRGVRVHHIEERMAEAGHEAPWGGFDETSPAGLCFTSGTTGDPKGVIYTHRSSYLHTLRLLQADVMGFTREDRILAVVPMFHANGWGLPFAAPAAGATLVLPGRETDGASLARLIHEAGVTVAAAVPTVWIGLLQHLDETGGDLPTLKRILVGGAPMPQQLMERIEARIGASVQTSWGMTELSPLGVISPPEWPQRRASVAGLPAVGVDFLLVDETGAALASQRGTEGRLRVKGSSAVQRYYGQSEPAVDADGWFDTGDLARIEEDGALVITGRSKDLIKSGGEWINPAEIEAIVGAMEEVALAAVVARPHPKWGERPVLFVELREGRTVTEAAIRGVLQGRVAAWWIPEEIVRMDRIPLAATGKIDKRALRARLD